MLASLAAGMIALAPSPGDAVRALTAVLGDSAGTAVRPSASRQDKAGTTVTGCAAPGLARGQHVPRVTWLSHVTDLNFSP